MDGTGSGSCAVAGFGISGVEPSGSATRDLVILVSILNQPQLDLIPCSIPFSPIFSPFLSPFPVHNTADLGVTDSTTCTCDP